jgi:hypothetical protein
MLRTVADGVRVAGGRFPDEAVARTSTRTPDVRAAGGYFADEASAIAATLSTFGVGIATNTLSGFWDAVVSWDVAGVVGNGKQLDVVLDRSGAVITYEVRDDQRYVLGTGWVVEAGTVGVRITRAGLGPLVGDLEAAINAGSALCTVTTPDPLGGAFMDPGVSTRYTGTFAGGVG